MDDPNITMEEYIRLEEEKARRNGKVYNWKTATYGKVWYDEDVHDLRSVETKFPAIVFDDAFTTEVTPSYEPTAYRKAITLHTKSASQMISAMLIFLLDETDFEADGAQNMLVHDRLFHFSRFSDLVDKKQDSSRIAAGHNFLRFDFE
nr:hypothetical protein [Tanacetum cinerariifolium]